MKKGLFIVIVCVGSFAFSQKSIKKMAEETCSCAKSLKVEELKPDEVDLQLGLCIFQSYNKYKSEYEKETGTTLELGSDKFEELAENIGLEMAANCPEVMLGLVSKSEGDSQAEDSEIFEASGEITNVEKNQFYTVSFKTKENSNLKFLFLYEFDNSNILLNPSLWKNKNLKVGYSKFEFFDPRIDEFNNYNVIEYIEIH